GKRGDSEVTARGEVSWPDQTPMVVMQADAKNITLDAPLHSLLPPVAQRAWDQVQPQGTIDATLNYSGGVGDSGHPASGYEIVLTPRKLSATLASVPYKMDDLTGSVTILPDRIMLKDFSAHHGDSKVKFTGTGTLGRDQTWDFAMSGANVPIDDDLRKAVPQSLASVFTALQLNGKIDFEFTKLHLTVPSDSSGSADSPPPDADFDVKLGFNGASLDVGVPLADVKGTSQIAGSTRHGRLSTLSGEINADSMTLAGRPITKFRAEILKSADQDQLTIGKMEAKIAGGGMAGQFDYAFPDNGASRYAVNLTLRNADVRQFAVENTQNIQGQLSASFALEGTVDQPASRRGRGDVVVIGHDMYHIPLMLGLMQITNLALPISSPFTEASARYSIDGQRVTFEDIELRSKDMLMQGDGHLDFDTKQVQMRFVTDSAGGFKIPIIGDLLQQARHELLQIQVRGTLQEPKVSAQSMSTLVTTVDQVFKSEDKPVQQKKPK
ncbi:MAG TPA: hypothetical protein VKK61_03835, partial [Tepidisphaeraceae bacterium]|nr:hypothetical protein [Tepidisphaeraceae bacterium]